MASLGSIYNNVTYSLAEQTRRLAELQEQTSTGSRVNRASDAPTDAYRIMRLNTQVQTLKTFTSNLDQVSSNLEMAHNALSQITETISKVGELLTQAQSETYGAESRATIAEEIDSILEQNVSLANTSHLGQYLFAGSRSATAPFEVTRSTSGSIIAVNYRGADDNLMVPVSSGVDMPGLLTGQCVFAADSRSTPVFLGDTGAKVGSGTSSIRGNVELIVSHNTTTFAAGSGLASGSAGNTDSIVGNHTLTIDASGATKTIRLDGGPAVTFDGSETNLLVTNAVGDTIHLDTTGWSDFSGDVAVSASARLSIDGGLSSTVVSSFTDNVAVTDSATGRILYVNAADLARTGSEYVSIPGTNDLFGTLIRLRDVLRNPQNLPHDQVMQMLDQSSSEVKEVNQVITRNMTAIGGRLQAIDILKDSLSAIQTQASQQASTLQDADITQVATSLARTQTLYEMTMSMAGKLLKISLLDYL